MQKEYTIPVENLSRVKQALAAINKRARRLKLPEIELTIGETFLAPMMIVGQSGDVRKTERTFPHVTVALVGEIPMVAGWSFVAAIENLEGETIIRNARGIELPEFYRHSGAICEHCNKDRRRNKSYVLKNGTEFKAVGSSCLEDFTGAHNPFGVASGAELFWTVQDMLESGESMPMEGGHATGASTERFMQVVAHLIENNGFVSRAKAEAAMTYSTGQIAIEIMFARPGEAMHETAQAMVITDKQKEVAERATEWALDLASRPMSDFEHNLYAIAKSYSFPFKLKNLAACVVSSYLRSLEQEAEKSAQRATSTYIGEVGQRMTFEADLVFVKALDGIYGTSYLHKFVTPDGAVCVWFGSKQLDIEPGKAHKVKGTVKAHEERQGVKQTVFTRMAVA